ncbi:hypothetical protein VA249_27840 [Vibrio alfacsensis]|nr:hypothetical protein VA249_27840 [Vibrio alfacsensis]
MPKSFSLNLAFRGDLHTSAPQVMARINTMISFDTLDEIKKRIDVDDKSPANTRTRGANHRFYRC